MNVEKNDRSLHITTTGLEEKPIQSSHYNHYEATPYLILDALFDEYKLEMSDCFVDYGCGKGRVLFYVHNRFHNSVTGIEMNNQLYHKSLKNKAYYMQKASSRAGSIQITCCKAEEYEVKKYENRFYFFNPFSLEIFRKVVNNIVRSVEQENREVELILYYPTSKYIKYLETSTSFELIQEIKIPWLNKINKDERFLIYRFEG